jgi:hypothetical protein
MADNLYDQNLVQWLQLSGEYIIGNRPPQERTDWVLFLLDQMKPFLSETEYGDLLRQLNQAINQRLAEPS